MEKENMVKVRRAYKEEQAKLQGMKEAFHKKAEIMVQKKHASMMEGMTTLVIKRPVNRGNATTSAPASSYLLSVWADRDEHVIKA